MHPTIVRPPHEALADAHLAQPMRILRALLVGLHHYLGFAPILLLAELYLFSWWVMPFIGHWPEPSVDDPKFVAMGNWLADTFYFFVEPFLLSVILAIIGFPVLTWLLRRVYPRWWTIGLLCLFLLGLFLLVAEPTDRLGWYFD
jgi:hypothetical protein